MSSSKSLRGPGAGFRLWRHEAMAPMAIRIARTIVKVDCRAINTTPRMVCVVREIPIVSYNTHKNELPNSSTNTRMQTILMTLTTAIIALMTFAPRPS